MTEPAGYAVGCDDLLLRETRNGERVGEALHGTLHRRELILGVDPGARYTGVVLRDGDKVLYASTLVRDKTQDPVSWGRQVVAELKEIIRACPPARLAVEGLTAPKGFKDGKRQPINPGPVLFAGVVLGAITATWDAIVIPPGGNGSQRAYPLELVGRRPASLPGSSNGAGTRGHEQSAYDVAGKARLPLHRNALDAYARGELHPAFNTCKTVDRYIPPASPIPTRFYRGRLDRPEPVKPPSP